MSIFFGNGLTCWEPPSPPGDGGNAGNGGRGGDASTGAKGGDILFAGSEEFLETTRRFAVRIHGGSSGVPGIGGRPGRAGAGGPEQWATPGCGGHIMPKGDDGRPGLAGQPGQAAGPDAGEGSVTELPIKL